MTETISPRDRLIVALDLPGAAEAREMIAALGDSASFYKIGMELAYSGAGLDIARELAASGKKVFIDLKLHDIPNTVERATRQLATLGATFATVHAYPQTMAAAKRGATGSGLKLLAVTVMTSYDDSDLTAAGYAFNVRDLIARRARQAQAAGIDGLVMSPEEAEAMRASLGPDMIIVTPGVRPAGADAGDQKRVMTPTLAIAAGADYLVVGRPVTEARDPKAAAESIVGEIESGLAIRHKTNRVA
ncbi:MAG: orotidine-5'-phosphate decarboxylase [Hyphomicrobiales bacterium]|nr:orotidine-5'-phosphate decarboxylase [Hyphomicrobiales bacterium]